MFHPLASIVLWDNGGKMTRQHPNYESFSIYNKLYQLE